MSSPPPTNLEQLNKDLSLQCSSLLAENKLLRERMEESEAFSFNQGIENIGSRVSKDRGVIEWKQGMDLSFAQDKIDKLKGQNSFLKQSLAEMRTLEEENKELTEKLFEMSIQKDKLIQEHADEVNRLNSLIADSDAKRIGLQSQLIEHKNTIRNLMTKIETLEKAANERSEYEKSCNLSIETNMNQIRVLGRPKPPVLGSTTTQQTAVIEQTSRPTQTVVAQPISHIEKSSSKKENTNSSFNPPLTFPVAEGEKIAYLPPHPLLKDPPPQPKPTHPTPSEPLPHHHSPPQQPQSTLHFPQAAPRQPPLTTSPPPPPPQAPQAQAAAPQPTSFSLISPPPSTHQQQHLSAQKEKTAETITIRAPKSALRQSSAGKRVTFEDGNAPGSGGNGLPQGISHREGPNVLGTTNRSSAPRVAINGVPSSSLQAPPLDSVAYHLPDGRVVTEREYTAYRHEMEEKARQLMKGSQSTPYAPPQPPSIKVENKKHVHYEDEAADGAIKIREHREGKKEKKKRHRERRGDYDIDDAKLDRILMDGELASKYLETGVCYPQSNTQTTPSYMENLRVLNFPVNISPSPNPIPIPSAPIKDTTRSDSRGSRQTINPIPVPPSETPTPSNLNFAPKSDSTPIDQQDNVLGMFKYSRPQKDLPATFPAAEFELAKQYDQALQRPKLDQFSTNIHQSFARAAGPNNPNPGMDDIDIKDIVSKELNRVLGMPSTSTPQQPAATSQNRFGLDSAGSSLGFPNSALSSAGFSMAAKTTGMSSLSGTGYPNPFRDMQLPYSQGDLMPRQMMEGGSDYSSPNDAKLGLAAGIRSPLGNIPSPHHQPRPGLDQANFASLPRRPVSEVENLRPGTGLTAGLSSGGIDNLKLIQGYQASNAIASSFRKPI